MQPPKTNHGRPGKKPSKLGKGSYLYACGAYMACALVLVLTGPPRRRGHRA